MVGRPPFPTSSAATPNSGDPFRPLPLLPGGPRHARFRARSCPCPCRSSHAALSSGRSDRAPAGSGRAGLPSPTTRPIPLPTGVASAPISSTSLPDPHPAAASLYPGFLSSALSLPDAALFRSQLLAPGFPHVPLDMPVEAPVRDRPLQLTVYSQPSAITSSLRAPSNDAAALLVTTRAVVTAARQRAQDAARALEQQQAVVDAIERQYAETYHRLASKGVSDGSPTSAQHCTDIFEPAPAPASTLRASLHAQAVALNSIRVFPMSPPPA
jgi:hypothetical protein